MGNWEKNPIIRNEAPDGHFNRATQVKNLSLLGGDTSLPMGKQNVVLRRAESSSGALCSFGHGMSGEYLDPKSLRDHLQSQVSLWISPATVRREATSEKIISHPQNGVRTPFPGLMGSGGGDMGRGIYCPQPVRDLEVAHGGKKRLRCPAVTPWGAGNRHCSQIPIPVGIAGSL